MAKVIRILALAFVVCGSNASADDERAKFNYMMNCQGCHLRDAVGSPGTVPRMNGFLGYFLNSKEGREFIIRVPGVATSSLPDDQLAELVNWLLVTYSADELPKEFNPITIEEIASLRRNPEGDPITTRKAILEDIAKSIPALAKSLDESDQT